MAAWLREKRFRLSRAASVAKPIDYMLQRWDGFARFLEGGRICLMNNAAERALQGLRPGAEILAVRRPKPRGPRSSLDHADHDSQAERS